MKFLRNRAATALLTLLATSTGALATPEPGIGLYHVTYDNSPNVNFGPYAGLPNPNYNRLTFMLSHTFVEAPWNNHFHRIGAYSYVGSPATPTVGLSANNRVPEPYQADDGLALLPGSGVFAGKLVSGIGPAARPGDHIEQEYGDLAIRPMDALFPFDGLSHPDPTIEDPNPTVTGAKHPGNYLLNASGGVYKNSMASVRVGMELTDLTPGLAITDASGAPIWSAIGDVVTLGESATWVLNPVFVVEDSTALGSSFRATFKLVDLSTTPLYGESAPFSMDFVAAPEPTAAALAALASMLGGGLRRRG